jgi:hypothetical protein
MPLTSTANCRHRWVWCKGSRNSCGEWKSTTRRFSRFVSRAHSSSPWCKDICSPPDPNYPPPGPDTYCIDSWVKRQGNSGHPESLLGSEPSPPPPYTLSAVVHIIHSFPYFPSVVAAFYLKLPSCFKFRLSPSTKLAASCQLDRSCPAIALL